MAWQLVAEVYGTAKSPYRVALQTTGEKHGTFGCSCPAWTRGKDRHADCKHIKAMRNAVTACLTRSTHRRTTSAFSSHATGGGDERRIEFKAPVGDLFGHFLNNGADGFELDDLTRMAVLADAAPMLELPTLNWST